MASQFESDKQKGGGDGSFCAKLCVRDMAGKEQSRMKIRFIVTSGAALALVLTFQNCQPRIDIKGQSSSAVHNNGQPYNGKVFVEIDTSCPAPKNVATRVDVLDPTEAYLHREKCSDVSPARKLDQAQFSYSPEKPNNLSFDGKSLIAEDLIQREVNPQSAPVFIGARNRSTTSQNLDIPKPSGVQAGDLLIAFVGQNYSNIVTAPPGWTLISHVSRQAIGYDGNFYWKFADSGDLAATSFPFRIGEPTYIPSPIDIYGLVLVYRNTDPVSPIDAGIVITGTGSSVVYPSATANYNNSMMLVMASAPTPQTPTIPAGFTAHFTDSSYTMRVSGAIIPAGQTPSVSSTFSPPSYQAGTIVIIGR